MAGINNKKSKQKAKKREPGYIDDYDKKILDTFYQEDDYAFLHDDDYKDFDYYLDNALLCKECPAYTDGFPHFNHCPHIHCIDHWLKLGFTIEEYEESRFYNTGSTGLNVPVPLEPVYKYLERVKKREVKKDKDNEV